MKRVEERKVKDLMTHGIVMVPDDSMVIEVVRILVEGNIHGVVVTNEKNEPIGVVSEMDIPKAFGEDFSTISVTRVMSPNIKTIGMDENIGTAGEVMKKEGIHRLIVVDEAGRMRGMLSMWDIVMEIYDKLRHTI